MVWRCFCKAIQGAGRRQRGEAGRWVEPQWPGETWARCLLWLCMPIAQQQNRFRKLSYNAELSGQRNAGLLERQVRPRYNTNYWYSSENSSMKKNTSISLGEHFDSFIDTQLGTGRYASTSEIVWAGLRLLEEEETKLLSLQKLLDEGEKSELVEYSLDALIEDLDGKAH